jgi:protein TonB
MRKHFLFIAAAVGLASFTPAFAQKVEAPVPIRTVPPVYPTELRREGVAGVVKVKFTVDVQGNVSDPTVESSSNPGFDKAAIDAIKKWKFKPATQDGTPIAKAVSIPLKFTLDS